MQAFSAWAAPGGTLGAIVQETTQRVAALRGRRRELERRLASAPPVLPFAPALKGGQVRVIAEVKRRSPSKGDINPGLDPTVQAASYAAGGAAVISVLTEPEHFGGSTDDLETVRSTVRIPLLKKDFHIDDVQLLEARTLGASGVLLIARALEPAVLNRLVAVAFALGLEPLVETRSEAELERALAAGAHVVGVNCRDLETLEVDPAVPERLLPQVPRGVVAIWESGISTAADVERAAAAGADAVLVGSAIAGASDVRAAVAALTHVSTRPASRA